MKARLSSGIVPGGHLACSASGLSLSYDNQPSQPSLCIAQVELKYLNCTLGSHSVCAVCVEAWWLSVVYVASTFGSNINKGVGVYHAQTWLFNILLTLQSDLNGKAKGM